MHYSDDDVGKLKRDAFMKKISENKLNNKYEANCQELKNHIHEMLLDSDQKKASSSSEKATRHALTEWCKLETLNSRKYCLLLLPKLR